MCNSPGMNRAINFWEFLRGSNGGFEINRLIGALGTFSYIITANGMVFYECVFNNRSFDVTAYCLAFPSGLGVAVGAIAGAVAIKDRHVARAHKDRQEITPE